MSNSPLRDWIARAIARPNVETRRYEAHEVTRAPGSFGGSTSDGDTSDIFQRQSATQENNLFVTLFSAFDAVVTLSGMIHRPNNQFTPIGANGAGFQLAVKGDRALYQYSLTLGSSIAISSLNAVVSSASVNIPVNACWVIVQQTRPQNDGTSAITGTLLSGPVTLLQPLAYPGSPVQKTADSTGFTRLLDVANPAAGQEISITVPQGARWQPNTLHFQLQSNATAGTREVLLRYTSNVTASPQTEFTVEAQGTLQGPSQTAQYAYGFTLSPLVSANFGTGAGSSTRQQGLPGNRFLLSGESIVTQSTNLAAGDQYKGIVIGVTEVLDPTAPSGSLLPLLTWSGTTSGQANFAAVSFVSFGPGTYTITVNQTMTLRTNAVSGGGGGGGGGSSGALGGGGGGSGATAIANVFVLLPATIYTLVVGAKGAAGVAAGNGGNGTATTFTNTTTTTTLINATGGQGGNAAGFGSGGAKGTLVTGTGVDGIQGGDGNGSNGGTRPTGAGGGGGGGQGGVPHGGSGGDGSVAGGPGGAAAVDGTNKSGDGGKATLTNGGGGGGGGARFLASDVANGYGGGGGGGGAEPGGGAAGIGGAGGDGIGQFVFQSAP